MSKFRVWDCFLGQYWYDGVAMQPDGNVIILTTTITKARLDAGWTMEIGVSGQAKLLTEFYIGRKDKNGKEIYEKDVISVPRYKCHAILEVCWNQELAAFEGLFCGGGGSELFDEINDPEIIGNIHFNPELLEEKP